MQRSPFLGQKSKAEVFELYALCKIYGKSPSDIMGFTSPWLRWSFDLSVFHIATKIESLVIERDTRGNKRHRIEDVLVGKFSASAEEFIAMFGGAGGKVEGF